MEATFYHKFYPMYIDIGTIEVNWVASCIFVALLWISCTNCAGVDMHTYVVISSSYIINSYLLCNFNTTYAMQHSADMFSQLYILLLADCFASFTLYLKLHTLCPEVQLSVQTCISSLLDNSVLFEDICFIE